MMHNESHTICYQYIIVLLLLMVPGITSSQAVCLSNTTVSVEKKNNSCEDWINYAPNPGMEDVPIKYIRLAYHILQDENGENNFIDTIPDRSFLELIINDINWHFSHLEPLTINPPYSWPAVTTPYMVDCRIQLQLDTIFFHRDTALWDFAGALIDTNGPTAYKKYVINNTALSNTLRNKTIHIFIGGNYNVCGGQSVGKAVNMRGVYHDAYIHTSDPNATPNHWVPGGVLAHELCHSFGLSHNFQSGPNSPEPQCDDCSDNDPLSDTLNCPVEATTNNRMDYSPGGGYAFSQCQVGKMHYFLSGGIGHISDVVINNDCDINLPYIIATGQSVEWAHNNIMSGDLILEEGTSLSIRCSLKMKDQTKIILRSGASLILDGGTIQPACEGFWSGIEWHPTSLMIIKNGGSLVVPAGSHHTINGGSLVVEPGGRFEIESCATIEIKNGGLLNILAQGEICIHPGAFFVLDSLTNIAFEPGFSTGNCLVFTHETFEEYVIATPYTHTIEGDVDWIGATYNYTDDLIIETGSKLNISNSSELRMGSGTKIIVKQGGSLIIDASKITSLCTNQMWGGVEVWGNSTKSQYPDLAGNRYQGTIEMRNGALIENAYIGILAGSSEAGNNQVIQGAYTLTDISGNGGIVNTSSSTFRNNRIGIMLPSYENHDPQNQSIVNNLSSIIHCNFELTPTHAPGLIPEAFIKLVGVRGIVTKANRFTNNSPNRYQSFTGILSLNSGFSVDGLCADTSTPCQDFIVSSFEKLPYGIRALGIGSDKTFSIDSAYFKDNTFGVYSNGYHHFTVTRSFFQMSGADLPNQCGLYIDGFSSGFRVEENHFMKPVFPFGGLKIIIGIALNHTGSYFNEVYKNRFSSLYIAALAMNKNRGTDPETGLCFKCNTFENNNHDILVNYNNMLYDYGGIAENQGTAAPYPDAAAGNHFIPSGPNTLINIHNHGESIQYFFSTNQTETDKPTKITESTVYTLPFDNPSTGNENCPSRLNHSGSDPNIEELTTCMILARHKADSLKAIISECMDGGKTDELINEIIYTPQSSTEKLYKKLLSISPFLSIRILESIIEKETVLPEAMLRDILVANPHSTRSERIVNKLNIRWQPISDYLLQDVMEGQTKISGNEMLQTHSLYFQRYVARTFAQLVQLYTNELLFSATVADKLVAFFLNGSFPVHHYQAAYLSNAQDQLTQALEILDQIPAVFGFDSGQSAGHHAFAGFIRSEGLQNHSGSSILLPDSLTVQYLISQMNSQMEPVSAYARNILAANNYLDIDPTFLLPGDSLFNPNRPRILTRKPAENLVMKIYPNPARQFIIVEYDLTPVHLVNHNIRIVLTDALGKILQQHEVNKSIDQQVLSLTSIKAGIHVIQLLVDEVVIETQKIAVIR